MHQHDFSVWYGNTTEKILAWRELREQARTTLLEDFVGLVNEWWTYTPWVRKTVDPYSPATWPDPWHLINTGQFCRSAIALGQAYTLWICYPQADIEVWLVNNFNDKEVHLVVVIDKNTVLNYTLGQIVKLKDCDFEVISRHAKSDLPHIKI